MGVVVVAAGSGSRLGAGIPKAFVDLAGRPVLWYAVAAALSADHVRAVAVVVPADYVDRAQAVVTDTLAARSPDHGTPDVTVVTGGSERGDSVASGLETLGDDVEVVLVHDAARPLAPVEVFDRVAAAVDRDHPAVVPGLAVVDTVKSVDEEGMVTSTPDRAALRLIQTPQGFLRDVLHEAHRQFGSHATDDAGLVERLGLPVRVVAGDPLGHKLTTPADAQLLTTWIAETRTSR